MFLILVVALFMFIFLGSKSSSPTSSMPSMPSMPAKPAPERSGSELAEAFDRLIKSIDDGSQRPGPERNGDSIERTMKETNSRLAALDSEAEKNRLVMADILNRLQNMSASTASTASTAPAASASRISVPPASAPAPASVASQSSHSCPVCPMYSMTHPVNVLEVSNQGFGSIVSV